jgi:hypothetical protein
VVDLSLALTGTHASAESGELWIYSESEVPEAGDTGVITHDGSLVVIRGGFVDEPADVEIEAWLCSAETEEPQGVVLFSEGSGTLKVDFEAIGSVVVKGEAPEEPPVILIEVE